MPHTLSIEGDTEWSFWCSCGQNFETREACEKHCLQMYSAAPVKITARPTAARHKLVIEGVKFRCSCGARFDTREEWQAHETLKLLEQLAAAKKRRQPRKL
jgi:hypothetical protein